MNESRTSEQIELKWKPLNDGEALSILDSQKKAEAFYREKNLESPLTIRLLDLISEIGELAKEVLKATQYGKKTFIPGEEWQDELGDVLFSLLCVANLTNIDLEEALELTLKKYETRFENSRDIGSGK